MTADEPRFSPTIRWSLIVGTLLAVIVPLVVFALVSGRLLWSFYARELEGQLRAHGRLIADSASRALDPSFPDDPEGLAALVARWKRESNMRITLCDGNGIVAAAPQSDLVGAHIDETHQPGLPEALQGTPNTTVWKNPAYGYEDTMYVNLPVYDERRLHIVGAVRVAYTVSEIQLKVHHIERTMLWAVFAYGAIIVAATLSLGSTIARPVENLTRQARRLAEGDLSGEIRPAGSYEVRTLGHALDEMRRRLQRLEYLRRRRVSDVSHEIRTPLASIRAMAETAILHGNDDPVARDRFLGRVIDQTDRLAAFVNQLLDLEAVESGRVGLRIVDVGVQGLLERTLQTLEGAARKKGVHLSASCASPDLHLRGDPDRLVQVLVNLVENAVRYTPPGGEVSVAAALDGEALTVRVRDNGCGIPPDDLPHVFDRFYRVAKDRAATSGGAGLGLCIVREIVEAHGGRVAAESRVGEGTTFEVRLPFEEVCV